MRSSIPTIVPQYQLFIHHRPANDTMRQHRTTTINKEGTDDKCKKRRGWQTGLSGSREIREDEGEDKGAERTVSQDDSSNSNQSKLRTGPRAHRDGIESILDNSAREPRVVIPFPLGIDRSLDGTGDDRLLNGRESDRSHYC